MSALPIDPTDEQLRQVYKSAPLSGYYLGSGGWHALFQAGVEAERARAAAEVTEVADPTFGGRLDPVRLIAARDRRNDIRLSSGRGALIARETDTRAAIQEWRDRAVEPWLSEYQAVLDLLDREAQS